MSVKKGEKFGREAEGMGGTSEVCRRSVDVDVV